MWSNLFPFLIHSHVLAYTHRHISYDICVKSELEKYGWVCTIDSLFLHFLLSQMIIVCSFVFQFLTIDTLFFSSVCFLLCLILQDFHKDWWAEISHVCCETNFHACLSDPDMWWLTFFWHDVVTYLKQIKHILSILTLCILLLFHRIYHVSLVHTFESLTANLKAIIKSKGKRRISKKKKKKNRGSTKWQMAYLIEWKW